MAKLENAYTLYRCSRFDIKGKELPRRREEHIYVQVAKEIRTEETRDREYGRLLGIQDNHSKYMLLAKEYAGGTHKGIKTIHIADFLLGD
ncbi:hypothetical protein [uncultured Sphaerochaeta sp.]|uniref:hypothetical protein n=1 Tax=uncultured Sphaerochaeta sp. TaxID=886478 RepID=UPI002A0A7495|nr:hypothetical protein [uncultured Sphaerochaeta sp.]